MIQSEHRSPSRSGVWDVLFGIMLYPTAVRSLEDYTG
jgi:hypothetical protein